MVMKLRVGQLEMRKGFRVGVRREAVSVSVTGLVAGTVCDTLPVLKISRGKAFWRLSYSLKCLWLGLDEQGRTVGRLLGELGSSWWIFEELALECVRDCLLMSFLM